MLKPRGTHNYFHLRFYGTHRGRRQYLFLQYLEEIIFTYPRTEPRENTCLEISEFWWADSLGGKKWPSVKGNEACTPRGSHPNTKHLWWEITSRSPSRPHLPHTGAFFAIGTRLLSYYLALISDTVFSLVSLLWHSFFSFPLSPSGCRLYLSPPLLYSDVSNDGLHAECSVTA